MSIHFWKKISSKTSAQRTIWGSSLDSMILFAERHHLFYFRRGIFWIFGDVIIQLDFQWFCAPQSIMESNFLCELIKLVFRSPWLKRWYTTGMYESYVKPQAPCTLRPLLNRNARDVENPILLMQLTVSHRLWATITSQEFSFCVWRDQPIDYIRPLCLLV